MLGLLGSVSAFAADTTAPTKPTVTDDGAYTTSTTSLHATWTSSDPESGIVEYQYLIRQDSTIGPIIVNWTSVGTTTEVTRTGLSLLQGKKYYFGVKAKNGAGLWSSVGYSNGIRVDTTAPSAPSQPKEGSSSTDYDYDGDGKYTVYWATATDAESGIAAYELQERIGATGTWMTLSSTLSSRNFTVNDRLHNTRYYYRVRAKNQAGLWSLWSAVSDGMLVDKTIPSAVTVTDDGATTNSTTTLHATWTSAADPESGIAEYQYQIRRDSTSGTIIVNWTSVGLNTSVARTGLSLVAGTTYYIGVKAKNQASLFGPVSYSNGITVQVDTTPPTINSISPLPGPGLYAGNTLTIAASVTDTDASPLEYQFSVDAVIKQAWSPTATYPWSTTSAMSGTHTIKVEVRDAGGATSATQTLYLYLKPPGPP